MKRKVYLIDPGQNVGEGGTRHATRQTPHIGLCCLAMSLHEEFDVRVIDMPLYGMTTKDLDAQLDDLRDGDVVGITTATFNSAEAVDVAVMVKKKNKHTLVVVGGPHVNAFPTDMLTRCRDIDAAVVGEGEIILSILAAGHDQPDFSWDIPGVVSRVNGTAVSRPPSIEYSIDLEKIPNSDWGFLGLKNYHPRYSFKFDSMEQMAPLSTVRGCPYRCSFCDPNNLTEKLRWRSARHVVDEIAQSLLKHGLRYYYITDSVMSVPKPRFREFCQIMKAEGLADEVALIGQSNINSIDEQLIADFKAAGGEYIFFGLESGNEFVLQKNGKSISKERTTRMVSTAYDLGLSPRGSFILGLPYETEASALETIQFATSDLQLHSANFFILDFYPGTTAKRMLEAGEGGLSLPNGPIDWDTYVPSRNRAEFQVNDLSPKRLEELLKYAKSIDLPYRDRDLDYRQGVTESLYMSKIGRLSGEALLNRVENLRNSQSAIRPETLHQCAERFSQLSDLRVSN